jgi:hypothetical protein
MSLLVHCAALCIAAGPAHGVEGAVLAATDFRNGTHGDAMGWKREGLKKGRRFRGH